MKKKLLLSAAALALIFFLAYRFSKKSQVDTAPPTKAPQEVTVQTAENSLEQKQLLTYPTTVVGDQEISIVATSTGNALSVPFNLGDRVYAGTLLARIDDTGNTIKTDYKDFQSSEIQQFHFSKEQAEESLELAEKNYKNLKKAYDDEKKDPTLTKTVSKAQVDAAKIQIDIAEFQLKSASVELRGTIDSHLVTSPITGFITEKSISRGDSVSIGQPIAKISQTKNIKFQFFVDPEHLLTFKKGLEIEARGNNGEVLPAIVKNISPVAEATTKRFLIEAYPKAQAGTFLPSGTLTSVSLEVTKYPSAKGNILLPLAAVTIGQNESYIFINDNGQAKKVATSVVAVQGEYAEIKADLAPDAKIILTGAKLVQDGSQIDIRN